MVMATVGNIIKTKADGTCSTASVKNLSLQVIDEMNLLIPNVLVSFDDLDVSGNQATVNFFLQPKAKEALRRAIRNKGKTLRLNFCLSDCCPTTYSIQLARFRMCIYSSETWMEQP
jgi:hypothetical protein